MIWKKKRKAPGLLLLLALPLIVAFSPDNGTSLRFEVSFPESVSSEPITGRMFVILSDNDRREPRLQVSRRGAPFFGLDVENLSPGEVAVIDGTTLGSPVESLSGISAGYYYAQAMLNIYTRFDRSDGHTVWMHMDQWEGQNWRRSPGNLYSEVQRIFIDPENPDQNTIKLEVTNIIPPVEFPPDTEWVKRFRFQSKLLSEFWGYPIYIGATVQLPKDYNEHPDVFYPTVYSQGHFSTRAPAGFESTPQNPRSGSTYAGWVSQNFPRMLVVTFQHPCPYFDDSYAVNSVNVGPFGDAIMQELIPEIERRFRCIPKPYARVLTGGSTGGWESLALQVWYPDFFGGTWSFAPDPVDFRNVEGINIYQDTNAFYKVHMQAGIPVRVPIANTRNTMGEVQFTSRQRNHYELVSGTKGRSGEQLDIWSAVFGPLGEDGYFKPLFDKRTGEIDPEVAQYWKENYDIRHYLETNWETVGPKLVGKIHIICGDMDNFYLNVGCYYLEQFLASTTDPYYEGSFTFGPRGGHGWRPETMSRLNLYRIMADHITRNAPPEEDTRSWKYR